MGQLIEGSRRSSTLVLSDRIELPNRGSTKFVQCAVLMTDLGLPIGACTCHASQQSGGLPFAALCRHCTYAPMLSHEGPSSAAMRHEEPPGTDCHRAQGCHHVTDSCAGWPLLLHGRTGDMPHHRAARWDRDIPDKWAHARRPFCMSLAAIITAKSKYSTDGSSQLTVCLSTAVAYILAVNAQILTDSGGPCTPDDCSGPSRGDPGCKFDPTNTGACTLSAHGSGGIVHTSRLRYRSGTPHTFDPVSRQATTTAWTAPSAR
jgi:hypothetical protein